MMLKNMEFGRITGENKIQLRKGELDYNEQMIVCLTQGVIMILFAHKTEYFGFSAQI